MSLLHLCTIKSPTLSTFISNKGVKYKKLRFGEHIQDNWGLINIYDEHNQSTEFIGVRGPIFSYEKLDELLKTKKLIGISAYQNFPQPLKNKYDDYTSDTFLEKYEHKIILWCHCFKDPQNYIPPGIPLLLYSDSDQYSNEDNLHNLADKLDKRYDFFCSLPNGEWNSWIRGTEIAKEWLNYMADIMNLKILVGGGDNNDGFSERISFLGHLPWNEFIKNMNTCKFLINFSRYDASPRIIIEALSSNMPVLLNENILGGWKYINKSTGKLFFYEEPIEKCINNFMNTKYDPLHWMKLNFNVEKNKILLANSINRLMCYKYEDFLDGIMYINLAEREDRNTSMLENFKQADIPTHLIHRIDAVLNKTCGHLGCTDSHIKALEYAKEKNWKRFLILEDDVMFKLPKERMLYILSEFFKLYTDKWDVFMLYTYWNEQVDTETDMIKKISWGTTGTSYIVNEKYVDTLLHNFKEGRELLYEEIEQWKSTDPNKRKYLTDFALDQFWFKLQRTDKWYISNPYVCNIKPELYSSTMS